MDVDDGAITLCTIVSTAEELLNRIMDCTKHPDKFEVSPMQYSEDAVTDESDKDEKKKTSTANTKLRKPTSYAQAAYAPNSHVEYKVPLKNTVISPLQLRASLKDVLLAIEEKDLDKDLDGVQLIRGTAPLRL